MKILQITAAYKPAYVYGGPTMSVAALSENLQAAGCRVQVFTTTANGAAELNVATGQLIEVDQVKVIYFKRLTRDHSHFSPALLKALWAQVQNYDVVHIHAWWNLVSVLSCFIALIKRVPVVVSPRGTLSTYSFMHRNQFFKRTLHRLLNSRVFNRCYLHATSQHERADLALLTRPKLIAVIYNFVKLPVSMPAFRPVGKPLQFIFLSRIDAKKGLELLLDALRKVTFPYELTIAGSGDEQYISTLKEMASAFGLNRHIRWLPFQGESKFSLLAQHDVMILPSYNENFGNVVIESLSVGTAVLVSNQVGLADYVNQHGLGWVCPPDAAGIAAALNQLSRETVQLNAIRQSAPALIHKDFSGDALAQQYTGLYKRAVNGR